MGSGRGEVGVGGVKWGVGGVKWGVGRPHVEVIALLLPSPPPPKILSHLNIFYNCRYLQTNYSPQCSNLFIFCVYLTPHSPYLPPLPPSSPPSPSSSPSLLPSLSPPLPLSFPSLSPPLPPSRSQTTSRS